MCFVRATSDTKLCSSPTQEWMLCKNCSQKPHQSCKINSDFATWTTKRFQPVLVSPTPYNLNPKPFTFSLSTCLVWVCLFGLISIFYPFPSLQDQSNENVDKLWMVICFSFIGLKIQNGLQSWLRSFLKRINLDLLISYIPLEWWERAASIVDIIVWKMISNKFSLAKIVSLEQCFVFFWGKILHCWDYFLKKEISHHNISWFLRKMTKKEIFWVSFARCLL
jgi:hypothetical protein